MVKWKNFFKNFIQTLELTYPQIMQKVLVEK